MNASDTAPASWPRPYWLAGGEDPLLVFFVFGRFGGEPAITAQAHDATGLPAGVTLQRHAHEALRAWDGYPLGGALGESLRERDPEAFAAATAAPEVMLLRGSVADGPSLDYLRDAVAVVRALLGAGGEAVVDPQALSLFDRRGWDARHDVAGSATPRRHLLILCAEDGLYPGRAWVHTRGMRKFGRPDISLRNVPRDRLNEAGELCERLVDLQAMGARILDRHEVEVTGLVEAMVARIGGGPDDPAFSNSYLELRWPA